jgi:hypothetical protein
MSDEAMSDETVTEHENEDAREVDEESLAGLSEYSATGGGFSDPHISHMTDREEAIDEPEIPDPSSFRELYRYSLGRATQDAYGNGDDGWAEGGALHVLERKSDKRTR